MESPHQRPFESLDVGGYVIESYPRRKIVRSHAENLHHFFNKLPYFVLGFLVLIAITPLRHPYLLVTCAILGLIAIRIRTPKPPLLTFDLDSNEIRDREKVIGECDGVILVTKNDPISKTLLFCGPEFILFQLTSNSIDKIDILTKQFTDFLPEEEKRNLKVSLLNHMQSNPTEWQ